MILTVELHVIRYGILFFVRFRETRYRMADSSMTRCTGIRGRHGVRFRNYHTRCFSFVASN